MAERAITLLHLSDLQFGPHHRFGSDEDGVRGSLLDRLALDRAWIDAQGRPDLILLTGDLAEHGKKSQLDEVHRFASGLARLLDVPARSVVLVPGNHDINWSKCEAYFKDCEGDEVAPKPPYWSKLDPYAELFARFYEGQPGVRFDEAQPWTLFEYPDLKVVVAGLNSTMAESHRAEDHHGYLGEDQIDDFARKLRPYKEQGWLRIGAVHHDLLSPEGPRAKQDHDLFVRVLGPYLNVVLHGHIHRERVGWCDGGEVRVPFLGIGSTGVKAALRVPEVGNQYQVVRLSRDRFRCEARRYEPDQRRWVGDQRIDLTGQTAVLERKVAFERVEATFAAEPAEAGPSSAEELARAVERYRQHVVLQRQTTLLELMSFGEDRNVDFLQIFVVPNARPTLPARDPARERFGEELSAVAREPIEAREAMEDRPGLPPMHEAPVQRIDRVLGSPADPWVLVLGAPGAGKTAMTRWLMLALCEPAARIEGLQDDLVPVRIELRRFDDAYRRASRRPYDFFDHLDDLHAERFLPLRGDLLRELARRGRLLWIFDGLDEVPDPRSRRLYAEMIAGLKAEHPSCRGLITSRIAGVAGADALLHAAGLSIHTLLDLDDADADVLLDRWHTAVFVSAPELAARRRERLAIALQESPSLRRLCASPLLATMIAYLNREEELPRRRHQLYQKVIERMADQWDAAKDLPVGPHQHRFPLSDKLRFLRQLAWQMQNDPEGQANLIHEEALLRYATRFCEDAYDEEPDAARRTAEQLVQHLRERNHVLTLLGGRLFGFVHKTFLEHLAAADVYARLRGGRVDLDQVGEVFRQRWQDERWQETLMLICGLLDEDRPEDVLAVLQQICSKPGPEWQVDKDLDRYMAFVIRCLAEVERLGREPVQTFVRRLMDIIEHGRRDGAGPSNWYRLILAFRLHAGRWPEMDRLSALVTSSARNDAIRDLDIAQGYQCVLSAGGKARRLGLLLELLAEKTKFPYPIFTAGAALGAWADDEIDAISFAIKDEKNELTKLIVLEATISRETLRLASGSKLVVAAAELVRSSEEEEIQYRAARLLLKSGEEIELAKGVLLEMLQTPTDWLWGAAVELLTHLGIISDALPLIAERALEALGSMQVLVKLARSDSESRQVLNRTLDRIWTIDDDDRFHSSVLRAIWAGVGSLDEVAFFDRFDRIAEDIQKFFTAELLLAASGAHGVVGLHALERVYDAMPTIEIRSMIGSRLSFYYEEHPQATRLLTKIMSSDPDAGLRIEAAGALLKRSSDLALIDQACGVLLSFTVPGVPERTRRHAARNLGGQQGFDVLSDLARSASDERLRRLAAAAVSDRAALLQLATSAEDKDVRRFASHDLRTLQLLHALRQVGRPRRGQVRLDGRPAGVIEELPGGGSRFAYDAAYLALPDAVPVSLTLPLRKDPYDSGTLLPFFENLLPEGWLLEQTSAAHGISRTDAFGLMLATCADCAGAVEILPLEEPRS